MIKLLLLFLIKTSNQICLPGCLKCTADDECQLCDFSQSYYLSNGYCSIKNKNTNCLYITLEGNCYQCADGYYLNSSSTCTKIQDDNLISNCSTYDKNLQCTQCNSNYYLNNNACVQVTSLIANCDTYTSNGICSSCNINYILSYDNLSCIKVDSDFPNCLNFTYYNCITCSDGYFYNPNYYLLQFFGQNANYDTIESVLKQLITEKNDIQNTDVCQATQVSNCSTFISATECSQCEDQYYLDDDYQCQPYPSETIDNCASYSSLTACSSCVSGYTLINSTTCQKITEISNCSVYDQTSTTSTCLKCTDDYYLEDNECILRSTSIDNSIFYCESLDPYSDTCSSCISGYVISLDNLECRKAIENCLSHEYYLPSFDNIICKQCNSGYYLSDQTCVQGSDYNCETYHQSKDYCLKCKNMYYLTIDGDQTSCELQPYIEYCDVYNPTQKNFCQQCSEGKMNLILDKICSFKKYIEYCISYREISGELLCIECKSQYQLIDQVCVPNNIPNCAVQEDGSDNVCLECTENFALFQQLAEDGNIHVSCVKPYQYQTESCEDMSVVSDLIIENQDCQVCQDYSINLDVSQNYMCIESTYLNSYNLGLESIDQFCLKYKGSQCMLCEIGYYLILYGDVWTCIELCDSGYATLSVEVVMDSDKYIVSRRNLCIEQTANEDIYGVNINNTDEIEYIPIKCKEDYITVVDLDNDNYSNSDINFHNQKWINDIVEKSYQVTCPILTNADQVNGQQVDLDSQNPYKLVPNCDYYIEIATNRYGCIKCSEGYTGSPSISGRYYSKCTQMTSCSDVHSFLGLSKPWAKLLSCTKCINDEQVPFIFLSSDSGSYRPVRFTFDDPSTFLYTGKTGTSQELSQQCVTATTDSLATLLQITTEENLNLVDNCALYFVDLVNQKSFFSDTSIDEETRKSLVKCLACNDGYKPDNDNSIQTCTLISNCDGGINDWFNRCSLCSSGYAYYVNSSTYEISFNQCILASSENCFATSTSGKCTFCKQGYFLAYSGICEIFDAPLCKEGQFTPYTNSPSLMYALYYQEYGVGCNQCETDFLAIHVSSASLPYLICFHSSYVESNLLTVANSTKYVQYCVKYENSRFNTQSFTTQMVCSECYTNYTLNVSQQSCVNVSTTTNCDVYDPETFECYQCSTGYGNVSGACVKGSTSNCATYNRITQLSAATCLLCKDGYFLNSSNSCVVGQVLNCLTYKGDVQTCTKCNEDYFLIDSLYFNSSLSYCLSKTQSLNCEEALILPHSSGARISCSSCSKIYGVLTFPGDDDIRTQCIDITTINNCYSYDIGTNLKETSFKCSQCMEGFYVSSSGYSCIARTNIITNCKTYNINEDNCSKCVDGYFYQTSTKMCKEYPTGIQNCINYISSSQCSQCDSNYYLKKNICYLLDSTSRITNCKYYADQYTCSECNSGYFLSSNQCTSVNISNCLDYEDTTICKTCAEGYGLVVNGTSTTCQVVTKLNCAEIDQVNHICSICDSGYYIDSQGSCQSADLIGNCLVYDSQDTCSVCETNYALSTDKQSCVSIVNVFDENCQQVKILDTVQCSVCMPSFRLEQGECVKQYETDSDDGCFTRDYNDLTSCIMCKTGYFMKKDLLCHKIINIENYYVKVEEDSEVIVKLLLFIMMVFVQIIFNKFIMKNFDFRQVKIPLENKEFAEICKFKERSEVNSRQELMVKNNGLTIFYGGKSNMGNDNSRLQTSIPIPYQVNRVFYFEAKMSEQFEPNQITVGVTPLDFPYNQYPGQSTKCKKSFGFNYEGKIFHQKQSHFDYRPLRTKDVVGIGINWIFDQIFFTLNGKIINYTSKIERDYFYPTLGVGQESFEVTFNFGKEAFLFDIENYVRQQQNLIDEKFFKKQNFEKMNEIVLNFLMTQGYKESFQKFRQKINYNKNFKRLMNHRDFLNQQDKQRKISRRKSSLYQELQLGSRRSVRRDSQGRNSLVKSEVQLVNENEEVLKLLKLRSEMRDMIEGGKIEQAENFLLKNFSYDPQQKPIIDNQIKFQIFLEKIYQENKECFERVCDQREMQIFTIQDQKVVQKKFEDIFTEILLKENFFPFLKAHRILCFQVINKQILESLGYISQDSFDIMKFQQDFLNEVVDQEMQQKERKLIFKQFFEFINNDKKHNYSITDRRHQGRENNGSLEFGNVFQRVNRVSVSKTEQKCLSFVQDF